MNRSTPLGVLSLLALASAASCTSSPPDAGGSASASAAAPAPAPSPIAPAAPTSAAPAASTPSKPLAANAVEIGSLKIWFEPPAGVKPTIEERPGMAIISFPGHDASLGVTPAHGDYGSTKTRKEKDAGWKRWVWDEKDAAIGEVTVADKPEYYGFAVRTAGESRFECGTLTHRKRTIASEKEVKKTLALCDGLRGK